MGELALKKGKKLSPLMLYDSKNQIENGTAAYYPVEAPNKAEIAAISNIDDLNGRTGRIPTVNNGYAIRLFNYGTINYPRVFLLPGADLTRYKKLHITSYIPDASLCPICIVKYTGTAYNNSIKQALTGTTSPYSGYSDDVFSLSLAQISGEWGIEFTLQTSSYSNSYIYKVWLEP